MATPFRQQARAHPSNLAKILEPRLPRDAAHDELYASSLAAQTAYDSRKRALDQLDERADDLQRRLEDLNERRRLIASVAAACRGVFSKFRRFPAEILGEIFLHYVAMLEYDIWAPLNLIAVCQHWRDVGLSTPRLWTSLPSMSTGETHCSFPTDVMKFWMARSGRTPLTVYLTWPFLYEIVEESAWDLCMAELERVESLDIHLGDFLPSQGVNPRLVLQPPRAAPLLRNLNVTFPDPDASEDSVNRDHTIAWALALIRSCSSLQKLTWRARTDVLCTIREPLTTLTHLSIEDFSPHPIEFVTILQSTPLLKHCDVSFDPSDDFTRPSGLNVTLQHLESFSISEFVSLGELFDTLTTPSLQKLTLYDSSNWYQQSFMSLLQRSSCHLPEVSIRALGVQESDVLEWLTSEFIGPSLVKLEIYDDPVYDSALRYLTFDPHNPPPIVPLPKLRSLCLTIELANQFLLLKDLICCRTKLDLHSVSDLDIPPPIFYIPGVERLMDFRITAMVPGFPYVQEDLQEDVRKLQRIINKHSKAHFWIYITRYECVIPLDAALSLSLP